MSAEFNIIFGFSSGVKGFVEDQDQKLYGKDFVIIAMYARNGITYWFLCNKLDKKYVTPNIPRYSQEEATAVAQKYLDCYVNETVRFKDLWDNRVVFSMHPLEEYLAKRWTWNRFVAIGDAVHKVSIY
jgi:FAD dependent monooxygenase